MSEESGDHLVETVPAGDPRARRAAAVIAAAAVLVAATGALYLHPWTAGRTVARHIVPGVVSPTAAQLSADAVAQYAFVSASVAWSVVARNQSASHFWALETTDGGLHWQNRLSANCASSVVTGLDVRFFDQSHGLVLACAPTVLYTTGDGGGSWVSEALPAYAGPVVSFVDMESGWVFGSTVTGDQMTFHLAVTTDGGMHWTERPLPSGAVFDVRFRSRLNGWAGACLDQPGVYATTDGGMTWILRRLPLFVSPPFKGGCSSMEFLPLGGVLATTYDSGGVEVGFTSVDGGASWRQLVPPPGSETFDEYVFVDAMHWWAMGSAVLYKSSDAGQTWKQVSLMLDNFDYIPTVIDSKHAWAVLRPAFGATPPSVQLGDGLATTADGGLHWTYVSVSTAGLS